MKYTLLRSSLLFAFLALSASHPLPYPCELLTTTANEGESTRIFFKMYDFGNSFIPSSDLAVYHARQIHVHLFSHSLSTFWHLHPETFANLDEMSNNGSYWVEATFPYSGSYLMNVDFLRKGSGGGLSEGYCAFNITVMGDTQQPIPNNIPVFPERSSIKIRGTRLGFNDQFKDPIYIDDVILDDSDPTGYGYQWDISNLTSNSNKRLPSGLFKNSCLKLEIRITNVFGGDAIDQLQPFLGAPFHIAMIHESRDRVHHFHGVETGHGRVANCDDIHIYDHAVPPIFGPGVEIGIELPMAGRWTIVTEMKFNTDRTGDLLVGAMEVMIRSESDNAEQPTMPITEPTPNEPEELDHSSAMPNTVNFWAIIASGLASSVFIFTF